MSQSCNNVGCHRHYDRIARLNAICCADTVYAIRLPDSDGKADPVLVECGTKIPNSRGMVHFFHPGLVKRAGVPTFMYQSDEPPGYYHFVGWPIAPVADGTGYGSVASPRITRAAI